MYTVTVCSRRALEADRVAETIERLVDALLPFDTFRQMVCYRTSRPIS